MALADELQRIPSRVTAGVAVCDRRQGTTWVWKINLATLDQRSGYDCVAGQLYGNYADAIPHLGFTSLERGKECGFSFYARYANLTSTQVEVYFRALTIAWSKQILNLRTQRLHLQ